MDYERKLKREQEIYKDVVDINDLPPIFHYWSHKYLRPMVEEFGASSPDQWFANNLVECAARIGVEDARFFSIGAGNCDTEVRVAKLILDAGVKSFRIECLDINRNMLDRGRAMAAANGVIEHFDFIEGDFNAWEPSGTYTGVMANQSLHHVVELERLFDAVTRALHPKGMFVISDTIGRNGHMRWPEALDAMGHFWAEMPDNYKYNRLLKRHERRYENWDCSGESFEGIRAQDIVPLLLARFQFYKYIGFANVIDVFIDRSFGHNFDDDAPWDREFIDRVHACDEAGFASGALTPTHMFAVLTVDEPPYRQYSRGLSPENAVHEPVHVPPSRRLTLWERLRKILPSDDRLT